MNSIFVAVWHRPYLILALLIGAYAIYKLAKNGKAGQDPVMALLAALPGNEYTVLSDVMIKSHTGASHMDHIVVSTHGVFVVDVQRYCGEIAGKDTDQYWTCSGNGAKCRFFNPIRQNHSHLKALEMALETAGRVPLIPVVVFPRGCVFKSKPLGVLYDDELPAKILSYSKNTVTKAQVEVIAAILERANIKSPEERMHYAG